MPQGLQVFDASGNTVFDTNYRPGRFHGSVSTGTTSGSINVPSLSQGTAFYMVLANFDPFISYTPPSVSLSGTTISWTAGSPCTIYYGTY